MEVNQLLKLPSYRNQFLDLYRKSNDWFIFDGNTGQVVLADVIILQIHLENNTGKLNAIKRKIYIAAATKLILSLEL